MQQLHLVGFTTDLEGLIFSARRGSQSGGYLIVLDEQLLARINEALELRDARPADTSAYEPRGRDGERYDGGTADVPDERAAARSRPRISIAGQDDHGRPNSALTPREIQARLRSGFSIAQVAAEAGVGQDWIARFAAPILAEQQQVLERSRSLVFDTSRKGVSSLPLGASVEWAIADRGVSMSDADFEDAWSAYQLRDGTWVVRFSYTSRKREQHADWQVDLRGGSLTALNRLATELGYVGRGARNRRPEPMFPAEDLDVATETIERPRGLPHARPIDRPRLVTVSAEPDIEAEADPEPAPAEPVLRLRPLQVIPHPEAPDEDGEDVNEPEAVVSAPRRATGKRSSGSKKVAAGKAAKRPADSQKRVAPTKAPATAAAAKATAKKEAPAAKATVKKASVKAQPSPKVAAKKATAAKATVVKKTAAKSPPPKKTPATNAAAKKKATAKKAVAKTAVARKAVAKRATASKATAKKVTPKKVVATKTVRKRAATRPTRQPATKAAAPSRVAAADETPRGRRALAAAIKSAPPPAVDWDRPPVVRRRPRSEVAAGRGRTATARSSDKPADAARPRAQKATPKKAPDTAKTTGRRAASSRPKTAERTPPPASEPRPQPRPTPTASAPRPPAAPVATPTPRPTPTPAAAAAPPTRPRPDPVTPGQIPMPHAPPARRPVVIRAERAGDQVGRAPTPAPAPPPSEAPRPPEAPAAGPSSSRRERPLRAR